MIEWYDFYIFGSLAVTISPLFYPGRWLGAQIGGANGSTLEVVLLTLFNGILYALLFVLIRIIAKKTTGA